MSGALGGQGSPDGEGGEGSPPLGKNKRLLCDLEKIAEEGVEILESPGDL